MSWSSRQELTRTVGPRYRIAGRSQKSVILDEFVAATGYVRKHAIAMLGHERAFTHMPNACIHSRRYDGNVLEVLVKLWLAGNSICSKRLVPFIPELLRVMERCGHITPDADVRTRLLSISASTVDRLLSSKRREAACGLSTTKPGQLLKRQITVRTFADWDDVKPGFFEIDLVAHCGDWSGGSFLHTLVLTDVATGWIDFCPLLRRGEVDVTDAITQARLRLPMPILGLDTDNGSEFINYEMLRYCERESISFTRARAYKKNDQCHVEEKNGSVVRRLIGYSRYEGSKPLELMGEIYEILRLYVNFFQPSLKLAVKVRDGSHVVKKYDLARTPYQRLTMAQVMGPEDREMLENIYEALDPMALLSRLAGLQRELWLQSSPVTRRTAVTSEDIPPRPSAPISPVTVLAAALKQETRPVTADCDDAVMTAAASVSPPASMQNVLGPKRSYRRSRPASVPHTWRTRQDPFVAVCDKLQMLLLLSPERTAKDLLDQLRVERPDGFSSGQLRTLQRRVRQWRRDAVDRKA